MTGRRETRLGAPREGRRRWALCLSVLLVGLLPSAARGVGRVVAIGDIHGDFDALVEILQRAALVDEFARWKGGDTTLVQTGDFLDRGSRVREVMDLLMRLQQEAPRTGGQVVVLFGNHEAMNVFGAWRDVSPEAYAAFSGPDSAARRQESWQRFVRWSARQARARGESPPSLGAVERAEFERNFPLGFVEYAEAVGPEGRYGQWLRTLPVVSRQGEGIFLHGGISQAYASWSVERINQAVSDEIAAVDECWKYLLGQAATHETLDLTDRTLVARAALAALEASRAEQRGAKAEQVAQAIETLRPCTELDGSLLIAEDGPLWFRGFARWTEEEGLREVPRILEALDASYFVAGHTPQRNGRIQRRFGGLAFLIDTGMLRKVYHGSPSALEIVNGEFFALYPDGREQLEGPAPVASATSGVGAAAAR
jgi:hypothetical protein